VEQTGVPLFHQASVAGGHFSEIPTRNVFQQLDAEEKVNTLTYSGFSAVGYVIKMVPVGF